MEVNKLFHNSGFKIFLFLLVHSGSLTVCADVYITKIIIIVIIIVMVIIIIMIIIIIIMNRKTLI